MGNDKRYAEANHAKNRDAADMLEIRTEVQACLHQLVDRVEEHDIRGLIPAVDEYTHTQALLHRGSLVTMWDLEKELRDGLNSSLVAQMKAQNKAFRHDVDEKLAEQDMMLRAMLYDTEANEDMLRVVTHVLESMVQ
jgi:hypothetical protein